MTRSPDTDRKVVIVGGGPVGLFLACCLHRVSVSCTVLERDKQPHTHSRSIGVHPVSLELFAKLGFAKDFIEVGQPIEQGHAYIDDTYVGTVSFSSCPPPFGFILMLPQHVTEQILEQRLCGLDPLLMQRNAEVKQCVDWGDRVEVTYKDGSGVSGSVEADFVVGCDGIDSTIRQQAGIGVYGGPYADTYVMGDFADNTGRLTEADIYLHRDGLIESFPLPGRRRRWVVKTDVPIAKCSRNDVEGPVKQRIHHDLSNCENYMLSAFGVQQIITETFVKNRVLLAGDAAHIISPIGGQGMNLGWLDAWDLARALAQICSGSADHDTVLRGYNTRRIKAARKARRRAEFNMYLGRKPRYPMIRNAVVRVMLSRPLRGVMARVFTMRGLDTWPA
ncbi:MAG: FAD-dependent monooxygenase [Gammaproteobacteria bacterium]|nr:FAD-dependent monooxygenase [Gammaproteobacteria bacterium]MCI0590463.1 FAD-dependent monooxygenase [Gammaproteobacteria bacterium]